MLIVKDNDTVYLTAGTFFLIYGEGDTQYAKHTDNIPVWRVPNRDNILVGVARDGFGADIFRYDPTFVSGELTMEKLVLETIPKIKKVLKSFDKLDKKGNMNNVFCFAQGSRAFIIRETFDCDEVDSFTAFGFDRRVAMGALNMTEGMPAEERLRYVTQILQKESDRILFPLTVINTKTCTPYTIK